MPLEQSYSSLSLCQSLFLAQLAKSATYYTVPLRDSCCCLKGKECDLLPQTLLPLQVPGKELTPISTGHPERRPINTGKTGKRWAGCGVEEMVSGLGDRGDLDKDMVIVLVDQDTPRGVNEICLDS